MSPSGVMVSLTAQTPARRPAPNLPARHISVLMYHHLVPAAILQKMPPDPDIVSVEQFQQQMEYLTRHQYRTLTMAEAEAVVLGRERAPERAVAITFDDGYQSNYIYAYPILKHLHQHATIFAVTAWITDAASPFDPMRQTYLSWPELRAMQADGTFEVQSHTDNLHHIMNGRAQVFSTDPAQAEADLRRSEVQIVSHLGNLPFALAYPYGAYNRALLRATRQAGFRLGFRADDEGPVAAGDPPLLLKRYFVAGTRGLNLFARMAAGQPLWGRVTAAPATAKQPMLQP